MTIFPDWRAIGAVMHWARTVGADVKVTKYRQYSPAYICHQWTLPTGARITVGSYAGSTNPDMTVVNGAARYDGEPTSAADALNTLGVLGVIPAALMELAQ
ncbi:hypothetical protein ACWT_5691 [Actinoplanes sp. SE50]|uniref:hypothetical protein n=1 Tax=unclassified Actinoplanes TaxID=2626549 RepID=UPI00023ED2DA|nr:MULTISPECIES: hypothetical protein [unclassified Actinoplanes]AEV86708.1 hypothetical protein ACPL_5821 [Actinoplanes sp. SE50/110]ATO85106.1 hypothetical protein ACWT_5691 [Actinoplanes sp. SE50]SLM02517.1 hypothetical protein ACSP50_5767 [Actinoplanes sp. SE50/110]